MTAIDCLNAFDATYSAIRAKLTQDLATCNAIQDPAQRLQCKQAAINDFTDKLADTGDDLRECVKGASS